MANDADGKKQVRTSRSEARLRQSLEELSSSEASVRRKAATRLGKPGNAQAVALLCNTLQDSSWCVRRAAARALGRIGNAEAIEPLSQALQDKSLGVQRAAALALGLIGDARGVEALCRILSPFSGSPQLRLNALEALIQIGGPAVAQLRHRVSTLEETLNPFADDALRQIANYKTPKAFLAVLADAHVDTSERYLCLEALRERLGISRRLSPSLTSVQKFCEQSLKSQNNAACKGAREVLDYLTLGRAGQRDLSADQGILLRAAEGRATTEGADQLLRASDAGETPLLPADKRPPTLLDRLKRLFHPGEQN